jgi:hypothetical protein
MSDDVQTGELEMAPATSYDTLLVAVPDQAPVYLVVNGQKCWVPDESTLRQLCGSAPIHRIAQAELDGIPRGPDLARGAYVATVIGEPMYLISGEAHVFATNQLFHEYPFDPANVRTVSQMQIIELGLGWEILS